MVDQAGGANDGDVGDQDAYAEAAWASYQAHALEPLPTPPAESALPHVQPAESTAESALPHVQPAAPGGLSGSLLAPATWRQAWGVATSRASRPRRRDAA